MHVRAGAAHPEMSSAARPAFMAGALDSRCPAPVDPSHAKAVFRGGAFFCCAPAGDPAAPNRDPSRPVSVSQAPFRGVARPIACASISK